MNYASLRQSLIDITENDSTEYASYIDTAVDMAEQFLMRSLDTFGFVSIVTTSLAGGNAFYTKPTNCLLVKSFRYKDQNGKYRNLIQKNDEWIAEYWPTRSQTTTVPKYYAPYDDNRLIIAGTPTSGNETELVEVVRPAALTSANTTNYFTDKTPNALLYSALVESFRFMRHNELAKEWERIRDAEVGRVQEEVRRNRRDDGTANDSKGENTIGDRN